MANRQQRRKLKEKNDTYTENTKSIVITLVVVFLIFLMFYLMTLFINNKNRKLNTKEKEIVEEQIQYQEILASYTFSMPEDEYYVLFYEFDSSDQAYYSYLASMYQMSGKLYTVNLSSGFNSSIVSDKSNSKAKDASQLKINTSTLIKIKNGKISKYITTRDGISKELGL